MTQPPELPPRLPEWVLGIESSCDEMAAAIVEDGVRVRSSFVQSQLDVHRPYGGVVPELASRDHVRTVSQVVDAALELCFAASAFGMASDGVEDGGFESAEREVQAVFVQHGAGEFV